MNTSHFASARRRLSAACARSGRRTALGLALVSSAAAFGASSAQAATGPYSVSFSEPSDLLQHTVYRPSNGPGGGTMPVLLWGEGACVANGILYKDFLTEIASHGILVIASGAPGQIGGTNSYFMDRGIDWAKAQNVKPGGSLAGKLDPTHVTVAGHSCGGLEAYQVAARRSEVAAIGIMNSGQLTVDQNQLNNLKSPILYVLGGSGDVAYSNGVRDFGKVPSTLPAFLGSSPTGHFGTYWNQNGGIYSQILKDWILWRIKGDATSGARFTGNPCGLCIVPSWTVQRRNIS
jgi:hypothetical protein